MIATWQDAVIAAPGAFLTGLIIGFVLSNRYRIERRNGERDRVGRTDDR